MNLKRFLLIQPVYKCFSKVLYRDRTSTMTFFRFSSPEIYRENTPVHCVLCKNAEFPLFKLQTIVNVFSRTLRWLRLMPQSHPTTGPLRESPMFFISYGTRIGPCGTRNGAVRYPYGHVRELTQPEFEKIPHGRRMWPYGPLVVPHGLFMGCLWFRNPHGARKLIMHALKLYGSCTGRQNSYGATRVSYGSREWTYDFCLKQPGNSTYREARGGGGGALWYDKTNETFKCNRRGRRLNVQYASVVE